MSLNLYPFLSVSLHQDQNSAWMQDRCHVEVLKVTSFTFSATNFNIVCFCLPRGGHIRSQPTNTFHNRVYRASFFAILISFLWTLVAFPYIRSTSRRLIQHLMSCFYGIFHYRAATINYCHYQLHCTSFS